MRRYWYKEAIIYTLDVKSFKDGNGDGIGDFKGLLEKFDYLLELGVNSVWLLPFYSSENRDAGYDVIDYYSVDSKVGGFGDFVRFMEKARQHDVKILMDLVVNHSSNKHPWFLDARKSRESKYRDYYIWLDEKPEKDAEDVVFKNVENSNWAYDEEAQAYYYHTFYSHQPDLNVANPEVQNEILKIIDFWMKQGVAGFRIDAVPHILRDKGNEKFKGDPYTVLDKWQQAVFSHDPEGILIAEADVEPKDYRNFLGTGERIHGLLNFYINNHLFLALADKDPDPIVMAFNVIPSLSENEQYLNFLRNHDELDLERLRPEERERVYRAFAPHENMRLYDRGIRRRLPPMVNNDRRVIELAFSLLFSLPGTPVLRYGEEIGMGDDLRLQERDSVRTPMQWDDSQNGGFSTAAAEKLFWPVISEGEYGYQNINVSRQRKDLSSLLNRVIEMIRCRQDIRAFGYGDFESFATDHPKVLGHRCRFGDKLAFVLHNFSDKPASASVSPDSLGGGEFKRVLGNSVFAIKDHGIEAELPPFGYDWWEIQV